MESKRNYFCIFCVVYIRPIAEGPRTVGGRFAAMGLGWSADCVLIACGPTTHCLASGVEQKSGRAKKRERTGWQQIIILDFSVPTWIASKPKK